MTCPSIGGVIVCTAAMTGLICKFDCREYRWTPYLYCRDMWVLAWIWGVFAGCAAHKNMSQSSETLVEARHLQNRGS